MIKQLTDIDQQTVEMFYDLVKRGFQTEKKVFGEYLSEGLIEKYKKYANEQEKKMTTPQKELAEKLRVAGNEATREIDKQILKNREKNVELRRDVATDVIRNTGAAFNSIVDDYERRIENMQDMIDRLDSLVRVKDAQLHVYEKEVEDLQRQVNFPRISLFGGEATDIEKLVREKLDDIHGDERIDALESCVHRLLKVIRINQSNEIKKKSNDLKARLEEVNENNGRKVLIDNAGKVSVYDPRDGEMYDVSEDGDSIIYVQRSNKGE